MRDMNYNEDMPRIRDRRISDQMRNLIVPSGETPLGRERFKFMFKGRFKGRPGRARERSHGLLIDPLHGKAGQLAGGLKVELFLDMGAVGLDGLRAEVQLAGDLLDALALADELE